MKSLYIKRLLQFLEVITCNHILFVASLKCYKGEMALAYPNKVGICEVNSAQQFCSSFITQRFSPHGSYSYKEFDCDSGEYCISHSCFDSKNKDNLIGNRCCCNTSLCNQPHNVNIITHCYSGSDEPVITNCSTETKYCVAQAKYVDNELSQKLFFCANYNTTICQQAIGNCNINIKDSGGNRTKVCCCTQSNCNTPLFLTGFQRPSLVSNPMLQPLLSFSPPTLAFLVAAFLIVIAATLLMMAAKKCSTNQSFDDDAASYSRLSIDFPLGGGGSDKDTASTSKL